MGDLFELVFLHVPSPVELGEDVSSKDLDIPS